MTRSFSILPLILSLLVLFIFSGCGDKKNAPKASSGVVDLAAWNFQHDGVVKLAGQWDFFQNQLLAPDDFTGTAPPRTGYLVMPSMETEETAGSSYFGGNARATLRLKIAMPEVHEPLTLAVRGPKSAFRLWVDGRFAVEDGKVGGQKETEIPGKRTVAFIPLNPQEISGRNIELVLQLSSHHGDPMGVVDVFRLGSASQMMSHWDRSRSFLLCFISILLLMGCYHLSLFAFRTVDPSPLYYGLFCLMWMTHFASFSVNRWLVYAVLPNLGYMAVDRMEMIGYFFSIPFIIYFYRALFPEETPARVPGLFMATAGILSLWMLSGLCRYSTIITAAHIVSVFAIMFSTMILLRALRHRRPSSLLIFCGSIILYICALNDILYDLGIIHTIILMRLGLLIFILCQSWALAHRFSKSFSTSEELFAEVQEKNIALSKLDKLKDEFLSNTSHELRTPLNGIIGISESLLTGAAGKLDDESRSNLTMVVHSGRRLARLVNEILDFSRLKNNDVTLIKKSVDLGASASAVVSMLEKTLSGKELILETRIPKSLPPVLGDEDRIQQILFNLLGNAVKFTQKGRITLSASVNGENISVSVTDTGSGIPADKLESIFEPFEQADAPAAGIGGTGLGLAITRKLVRLHGGRIRVESTPGKGTVFTFTLPIVGSDTDPQPPVTETGVQYCSDIIKDYSLPPQPIPPRPSTPEGHVILVVDDDPINLQVASNHLAVVGHGILTAADGAEALEIIRSKETPDLVLLDVIMPGMSGHEVCREIRKDHELQTLPVVMLTAAGRQADLVEGFAAGANDYLAKPFSGQELIARVNAQLKMKEAFEIMAENVRLKRKLARRRETVQHLLLTQRRLSELLDTVADAVLAVNEDHEIAFSNRACREFLGSDAKTLLGRPLRTIIIPETLDILTSALMHRDETTGNASLPEIVFTRADNTSVTTEVLITSLDLEGDPLNVLLIRTPAETPPHHTALPLIAELNRNQQRIQTLEETLSVALHPQMSHIREELKAVDTALAAMQQAMLPSVKTPEKPAVAVMNLCIDYWIESTRSDKFEMARQSGMWRVYTNLDGWERAQTLDKYLDITTLPKKPRWKQVISTAEFVLTFCESSSELRRRLEDALADLRLACR